MNVSSISSYAEESVWTILLEHQGALDQAKAEGRWEEVLQILEHFDEALEGNRQLFAAFVREEIHLEKSLILEKLDRVDEAIHEMDLYFQVLPNVDSDLFINYGILRKSALLLKQGRKKEAIDLLSSHAPQDRASILLYRFLEIQLGTTLLAPNRGEYEKGALEGDSLYRSFCLTMLGKIEEAGEVRKRVREDLTYLDDELPPEYVMLLVLQGDLSDDSECLSDCWEQFYHFSLRTYLTSLSFF